MSWAGPAEEFESTCEESAPEGAGEEQAPEGAGEEQAPEGAGEEQAPEGAGEEQALGPGSKPSPHNLLTNPGVPGGARLVRNWTEPVGKKVSWTGSGLEISQTLGHRLFPIQVGSVWELHGSMV